MFKRRSRQRLQLAADVSIPQSGFWVFKQAVSHFREIEALVSIPQSGFWVFKPRTRRTWSGPWHSFNPSVGILGVQASDATRTHARAQRFQSLSRDSGCSSKICVSQIAVLGAVSIPQSGFWVFKLACKIPIFV